MGYHEVTSARKRLRQSCEDKVLDKLHRGPTLSLAIKGLIVIALPALIQLLFLFSFNQLLEKA